MHNLLQFWNVTESMATFTIAKLVFRPLRLSADDKSLCMDTLVSI